VRLKKPTNESRTLGARNGAINTKTRFPTGVRPFRLPYNVPRLRELCLIQFKLIDVLIKWADSGDVLSSSLNRQPYSQMPHEARRIEQTSQWLFFLRFLTVGSDNLLSTGRLELDAPQLQDSSHTV